MSIDNIQLSVSLVAQLFKRNLVDLRDKPSADKHMKEGAKVDFLGGNEKNVVFLVHNSGHKFLNDIELKFLSDLISACDITMADIAIVNVANNKEINYNHLLSQFSSKKILCFGVSSDTIDLPFAIPDFQVQTFQEIQYIFCPGLEELQKDKVAKKQLWGSLQKIFNIAK